MRYDPGISKVKMAIHSKIRADVCHTTQVRLSDKNITFGNSSLLVQAPFLNSSGHLREFILSLLGLDHLQFKIIHMQK